MKLTIESKCSIHCSVIVQKTVGLPFGFVNTVLNLKCCMLFSFAKHLESMNRMFSFIWWIVGFYWITAGHQVLIQEAPKLYWYNALISFWVAFCVL